MKSSLLLGPVFIVMLLSCGGDALSPGVALLVGRWRSPIETLQPHGTMERLFIVGPDWETESHLFNRGLYANQAPGDLSSHEVLFGHMEVGPATFVIHPDSLVTTDLFYGPTYRHVQRDFSGWRVDSMSYQVRGNELDLEYYTYPADAPVLTRQVLYRVP